jgi:hypothetical protein
LMLQLLPFSSSAIFLVSLFLQMPSHEVLS